MGSRLCAAQDAKVLQRKIEVKVSWSCLRQIPRRESISLYIVPGLYQRRVSATPISGTLFWLTWPKSRYFPWAIMESQCVSSLVCRSFDFTIAVIFLKTCTHAFHLCLTPLTVYNLITFPFVFLFICRCLESRAIIEFLMTRVALELVDPQEISTTITINLNYWRPLVCPTTTSAQGNVMQRSTKSSRSSSTTAPFLFI